MVNGDTEVNLVERIVEETKNGKHIAIIGDAMTDHWVHGYEEECQDGCTKFIQKSYVVTSGGASNAATCLKHWNVNASLFSKSHMENPHKWRFVDKSGKIVYR